MTRSVCWDFHKCILYIRCSELAWISLNTIMWNWSQPQKMIFSLFSVLTVYQTQIGQKKIGHMQVDISPVEATELGPEVTEEDPEHQEWARKEILLAGKKKTKIVTLAETHNEAGGYIMSWESKLYSSMNFIFAPLGLNVFLIWLAVQQSQMPLCGMCTEQRNQMC